MLFLDETEDILKHLVKRELKEKESEIFKVI